MNLPIYKVLITDDELGIDKISLVEYPAVESNFLTFSSEKKQVLLSIDNEEQRIITGVIARADFPIYRVENGYEFYLVFDREVIKEMAMKMLCDNNQNNINLNHKSDSDVNGVLMLELYLKDTEKGINPKGFDDISDGSLFATYKVLNDEVWQSIKDGKYLGFSLEGCFDVVRNKTDEELMYDEILGMIESLKNKMKK